MRFEYRYLKRFSFPVLLLFYLKINERGWINSQIFIEQVKNKHPTNPYYLENLRKFFIAEQETANPLNAVHVGL